MRIKDVKLIASIKSPASLVSITCNIFFINLLHLMVQVVFFVPHPILVPTNDNKMKKESNNTQQYSNRVLTDSTVS